MKTRSFIYSLLFLSFVSFTGCQKYLDVVPDNDIETIEVTFEKREDAYTWFKTCYSMIVMDISDVNTCPAVWGTDENWSVCRLRRNPKRAYPRLCWRP